MALQLLGNRALGFVAKHYQAMVISRLNQYGENSYQRQLRASTFHVSYRWSRTPETGSLQPICV